MPTEEEEVFLFNWVLYRDRGEGPKGVLEWCPSFFSLSPFSFFMPLRDVFRRESRGGRHENRGQMSVQSAKYRAVGYGEQQQ